MATAGIVPSKPDYERESIPKVASRAGAGERRVGQGMPVRLLTTT